MGKKRRKRISSRCRRQREARAGKHRYRIAKSAGRCVACNKNQKLQYCLKCDVCYYKLAAARNIGDASRWGELRTLLHRQRGRCAYSGRTLELGRNASIEHIQPLSRDPARGTDIENIKWVDLTINQAKGNMGLTEFLKMCKEVLVFFGYDVVREEG